MLTPVRSTRFKRDVKKAEQGGRDMSRLRACIICLLEGRPLPDSFRDHALTGNWKGYRDVHIEPDWLLIYRVTDNELHLVRTGTHSEIFKK
ncbi:MAG: type II toxin-antitoxin system YafQ family toxin [Desulfovibrionaceae bacterium]|nr:type II toxin-antitoxin system YafQ family toxin [Desulfovibrionaceae bacterium]